MKTEYKITISLCILGLLAIVLLQSHRVRELSDMNEALIDQCRGP